MTGDAPQALIDRWIDIAHRRDVAAMRDVLADDVAFYSPVVHTPQRGKEITGRYLAAAFDVLFNPTFTYVRAFGHERAAVLEFGVRIDEIDVNGVDLITWDEDDRIAEFKVMLRPLKAINLVHAKMGEALQRMG